MHTRSCVSLPDHYRTLAGLVQQQSRSLETFLFEWTAPRSALNDILLSIHFTYFYFTYVKLYVHVLSGVTRGVAGGGVRTAPGDTLQGVTPEGKTNFVGKFTKNSGETRSDSKKGVV